MSFAFCHSKAPSEGGDCCGDLCLAFERFSDFHHPILMAPHPALATSKLLVHLEFSQPTIYSCQKKSHSSHRFYHTGNELDVRKGAETVISHYSSIVLSTWSWSFTQQLNLELSIGSKERCSPSFRKDRRREGRKKDSWKE